MPRFVLCAAVSWLVFGSPAVAKADDPEDKAEEFVKRLDGRLVRDDNQPGKPVTRVSLSGSKVTDAGLNELAGFKSLTFLDLDDTSVSDAGLKELARSRTSPRSTCTTPR